MTPETIPTVGIYRYRDRNNGINVRVRIVHPQTGNLYTCIAQDDQTPKHWPPIPAGTTLTCHRDFLTPCL